MMIEFKRRVCLDCNNYLDDPKHLIAYVTIPAPDGEYDTYYCLTCWNKE
jgi:hypothetical protein